MGQELASRAAMVTWLTNPSRVLRRLGVIWDRHSEFLQSLLRMSVTTWNSTSHCLTASIYGTLTVQKPSHHISVSAASSHPTRPKHISTNDTISNHATLTTGVTKLFGETVAAETAESSAATAAISAAAQMSPSASNLTPLPFSTQSGAPLPHVASNASSNQCTGSSISDLVAQSSSTNTISVGLISLAPAFGD